MSNNDLILFIAPANSIHSHKWISYFTKKNIKWISYNKIDKNTKELLQEQHKENLTKLKIFNHNLFPFISIFLSLIYILKHKPKTIHIHSVAKYTFLSILIFFFHKRIILTIWGTDFLQNYSSPFKKFFFNFIFKKAYLITTDGIHIKEKLIENFSDINDKIRIINFGINLFYYNDEFDNNNIRKELLNFTEKNNNFYLSTRGFVDYYGYLTIINAFSKIYKKNNYSLLLAGTAGQPYYLKLLQNRLKKLELEKKVLIIGHLNRDEMKYLYKRCFSYISASSHDAGISSSISEAMLLGKICVVSDNSDNKHWIKPGVNGLLFKTDDENDLYDKLCLLDNLNLNTAKEFSINLVNEKNKFENEMKKMEQIYFE